jgi:DHA1 family multidrug resistance protein-like MFS transporter
LNKNLRDLAVIHSATFTIFFAMSIVIPVLGPYLASMKFSDTEIGIIAMLMPLTSMLLRPITGVLADYWSRRHLVILGLILTSISGILYIGPRYIVPLGRILQGMGVAFYVPGSIALTSYLAKKIGKLGVHMSTRSLLNGLGFTIGPLASAYLTVKYGYHSPFIALAVAPIPFIVLAWSLEESSARPPSTRWSYTAILKRWFGIGRKPFIFWVTIAITLMATGYSSLQTFLSLYYEEMYGKGVVLAGTFFTISGLSSIPTRGIGGILAEKMGADKIVLSSLTLILVGSLTVLLKGALSYIVSPVFIGLGLGLLVPSMLVGVSNVTDNTEYGSAFSFSTVSWDVGGLIGPLIGGLLSSAYSYRIAIMLYPLLSFMGLLSFLYYIIWKRDRIIS